MSTPVLTGGCICNALTYESRGEPGLAGLCFCRDCRKVSAAPYVPFIVVARANTTITGATTQQTLKGGSGQDAIRHFCAACGAMVYGTPLAMPSIYTLYAASLDDTALFKPTIAMFAAHAPAFFQIPPGLKIYPGAPTA